ncbi:MAG TPA: ATP synthase F1 subunit delta, partial [Alphaproteobacteria bacterium]|nr:ATP synthase F1 subunit delta [Alphaproteobacteria bacterium]
MSQRGLFLNQIAQRYASALFDLAREQNMLDSVAQDLQRLVGLVDSNEDFRRFVGSAVVSREQSGKVMTAILARLGVSDLTRKFVMLLAEKRRLFVLPAVATAYRALYAELR